MTEARLLWRRRGAMTRFNRVILQFWADVVLLEDTHSGIILSLSDSVGSDDRCFSGCLGRLSAPFPILLLLLLSYCRYGGLSGADDGSIFGNGDCILSSARVLLLFGLPSTPVVFALVAFWRCRCRVAAQRFAHADTWLRQADIYVVRIHVAISLITSLDYL